MTRRRSAGYSLVELMVALVIGLVIMAAVLRVYVGMGQSVRTEDALSRVQENARFALEKLSLDVRQAGFIGCASNPNGAPQVGVLLNTDDDPDPTLGHSKALYANALTQGVNGWEYVGTAPEDDTFSSITLDGTGVAINKWKGAGGADLDLQFKDVVVPGSDVMIVRHADQRLDVTATSPIAPGDTTVALNAPPTSPVPMGTLVLLSDCAGADLFQTRVDAATGSLSRAVTTSSPGPGNRNQPFGHSYASDDLEIYTFAVTAYYVGRGASGEPALFRRRFPAGGTGVNEELVEGVESMQILYGEDTTPPQDGFVDEYHPANAVTSWDRVVAVRIGLLLRGRDEGRGELDTATYPLAGLTFDPLDARNVRHRVVTWTITLRNRVSNQE